MTEYELAPTTESVMKDDLDKFERIVFVAAIGYLVIFSALITLIHLFA